MADRLPADGDLVAILLDGTWVLATFHESAPIGAADGELIQAPHFELDDESGRLVPDPEKGGQLPEWAPVHLLPATAN